jgi:ribose-phosphate pyrophosphokinase
MTRDKDDLRVFAGSGSQQLVKRICGHLGVCPGKAEAIQFSDGNTFVRVLENVRGKDVFIVQTISTPVDTRFMELLFWIDAFRRASANEVTAVIPFFSYGKGDKKDEPRVPIRARVCADCLEAVGAHRVLTMDLHAPQIQGFFRVPVDHLYAGPALIQAVIKDLGQEDWVVVAPDAGYAKMARTHARLLGASLAMAEKIRLGHDEKPEVNTIIGSVKGKRTLIVDDFTTSAGTVIAAANRLLQEGATEVYAAISHGPLTAQAAQKVRDSSIKRLYITDSVENTPQTLADKISVVSVAPLFAEAIQSIFLRTSVSRLFATDPED